MAKIIHCLRHYPHPLSLPIAVNFSQDVFTLISSAVEYLAVTGCDLWLSAVLITNLLFWDAAREQKGPCEAERKGLVLVICSEQQPASSATSIGADAGKEQALGRDMDSPGPAHLGFSFGLQVVLYNTTRTPFRLPLSYGAFLPAHSSTASPAPSAPGAPRGTGCSG